MNDDVTDAIANLLSLKEMVRAADLQARKSLGQNFLFDLNLTGKIARAAKPFADQVIEIGPGPGGLTRALLLEQAPCVIAIEKDQRAAAFLDHLVQASQNRLSVIQADALRAPVWDYGKGTRQIVANLPYNIGTALLMKWLAHSTAFVSLTLMFQKEVAQRLVARQGSSNYGRLSVMTQFKTQVQTLFDIPPEAFVPAPKITSTVVQLIPHQDNIYPDCSDQSLERVTAIAFGQRRKMLRASFKNFGGQDLLQAAGINPSERPQDISVEGFCRLAACFEKKGLRPS